MCWRASSIDTTPRWRITRVGLVCGLLAVGLAVLPSPGNAVWAQGQPGGGGGGLPGGGGGGGAGGGLGGILIDAEGVIAPGFVADQSQRLNARAQRALAAQRLPSSLMTTTDCRFISLRQLDAALTAHLATGRSLTEEFICLAGLWRIDSLFFDSETRDIILAGPAEPFAPDPTGRLRGVTTGRPTLLLDDLLIVWRELIGGPDEIGCSIDPRPENLAALQAFLAQNSTAASPAVIEQRFQQMGRILGMHDVVVLGAPDDTRFARVMVEADYRMKRISMGLEDPGVKGLRSHLSLLKGGGNSMQRWWFVPLYDELLCDEHRQSFTWRGPRLQLLAQEELADSDGKRSAAATTRVTTHAFARNFTAHFDALANQSPVFADLQNLTDWCLVAALVGKNAIYQQLSRETTAFNSHAAVPTMSGPVPEMVPAMLNYKRATGGMIVGLVGGGVAIQSRQGADSEDWKPEDGPTLSTRRTQIDEHRRAPKTHWWWDAPKSK